jgi:DNA-binding transcriptional LysR family regulator
MKLGFLGETMRFTLKQLRYLDAAGRTGSIANAAEELSISQSSVTAAIDSLEAELGFDIFIRMPAKGILPTPSGRDVLAMVTQFLAQARTLESDLASVSGDPVGTLRLGCYATTAPFVLPPLLKEFARQYASIHIEVREGDMAAIIEQVTQGSADLGLTYRRSIGSSLDFVPLFRARPYAVLPNDHPLSKQASVSLKELADLPMIILDLPLAVDYYTGIFRDIGLEPKVIHSTKTSEMARALVAGGFGFTILNITDPGNQAAVSGYCSRPISDPIDAPYFGIAIPNGARRPAVAQRFIDMCRELAAQGVFDQLVVFPDQYPQINEEVAL